MSEILQFYTFRNLAPMKYIQTLLLPSLLVLILMGACEKPDYTKNQTETAKKPIDKPNNTGTGKDSTNTDTTKTPTPETPITSCILPYLTNSAKDSTGANVKFEFWKMTPDSLIPSGADQETRIAYDSVGAFCDEVNFVLQASNTSGKVPAVDVLIPQAFSPNGDGNNDEYEVTATGEYQSYSCQIFDRWGGLVFESVNPSETWDGTINGASAQSGTYMVVVKIDYFTTTQNYFYRVNYSGTINILI